MHINLPLRHAMLEAVRTKMNTTARLRIYSGAKPATSNLAPTGTLLVDMTLPTGPLAAPANGAIAPTGTWQDAAADATGTAGWARLSESGDTLLLDAAFSRMDLTVGQGSGELSLDNAAITAGQTVSVTGGSGFTMPAGT